MKVELKFSTPLYICSDAIRTCWQSQDKSDTVDMLNDEELVMLDELSEEDFKSKWGYTAFEDETPQCAPNDKALIERVGVQFKHASTLEHLTYNFEIKNISRALLQELARHRIASLSVKSTRYTLKELKKEEPFVIPKYTDIGWENSVMLTEAKQRASKYVNLVQDDRVNVAILQALENTRYLISLGISNDITKYSLVEAYCTDLAWTINARSLQNFLMLRTSKAALWEIRDLANMIYDALPEDHKYLFNDFINK